MTGWFKFMTHHKTKTLVAVVIGLALLTVGSCELTEIRGVGSYPSASYSLRLVDSQGHPLSNVAVFVVDAAGRNSFNYPVLNFQPERELLTDKDGQVNLQHIGLGPEYVTTHSTLLWFLTYNRLSKPDYSIVGRIGTEAIPIIKYSELVERSEPDSLDRTTIVQVEDLKIDDAVPHRFNPRSHAIHAEALPNRSLTISLKK